MAGLVLTTTATHMSTWFSAVPSARHASSGYA